LGLGKINYLHLIKIKNMKQYLSPLLTACSLIAFLSTIYVQNNQINKLRATQEVIVDSLNTELFNTRVENGRYELSLEHLKESNPKAAVDFEQFYNHETE
jgi:low affinity Fe/Cu permease